MLRTDAKISYRKREGVPAKRGVCSGRTPRYHEAKKVENLSRLGNARNGRQGIVWQ